MANLFTINTMTEKKYAQLSGTVAIKPTELNIVDDDDSNRLVIASYDLINRKLSTTSNIIGSKLEKIQQDVDGLTTDAADNALSNITLVYSEGKIRIFGPDKTTPITEIDATDFISDSYLSSAAYTDGKFHLYVTNSDKTITDIPVDFPVDSMISPDSNNPIMNSVVAAEISRVDTNVASSMTAIENETTRATGVETTLRGMIDVINGDGEGSINNAVTTTKNYTDQLIANC